MSTFIFLRHGHSAANATGTLTGQLPGVGLSKHGKTDAKNLIERIGPRRIDHLHLSPIERCQLTIDPWLRSKYSASLLSMQIVDGVSEIDFGDWSGRKLSSLRRDALWRDVQNRPSTVTFPEGESFKKVQRRAVTAVEEMRSMRGKEKVHLIVSHSDTIKLITAHYLQMKLDNFQSLQIDPASFTIFSGDSKRISLVALNSKSTLKEILG
jgi:probable phosphomutase (TIGR03848 family)